MLRLSRRIRSSKVSMSCRMVSPISGACSSRWAKIGSPIAAPATFRISAARRAPAVPASCRTPPSPCTRPCSTSPTSTRSSSGTLWSRAIRCTTSGRSASGRAASTSAALRAERFASTSATACGCSARSSSASAPAPIGSRLAARNSPPARVTRSSSRAASASRSPVSAVWITWRANCSPSTSIPSWPLRRRQASSFTAAACSRGIDRIRASAAETWRTSASLRWRRTADAASGPSVRRRIAAFSTPAGRAAGRTGRGAGRVSATLTPPARSPDGLPAATRGRAGRRARDSGARARGSRG